MDGLQCIGDSALTLDGGLLERLPLTLLAEVLRRTDLLSAFAVGQASMRARQLTYSFGETAALWRCLDMHQICQQGCVSGECTKQPVEALARDLATQTSLALLLLRLVPSGIQAFAGDATPDVLQALHKFAESLQQLQILRHSLVDATSLLSLLQVSGGQLSTLELSCPFDLPPGFLAALAASCPRLVDLSFSQHTRVMPLAGRWRADPGMRGQSSDNTQQQEQQHRHGYTLELLKLLASCPHLKTLKLPTGLHACNGVLLGIRRFSKLQRLQGARVHFASGEGFAWPKEVEQELLDYKVRQRVAAGLPPLESEQCVTPSDSKSLADLSYRVFSDLVLYMSDGCVPVPTYGLDPSVPDPGADEAARSAGGYVVIDDVAGRRLRIAMQYSAAWQPRGA